MQSYVHTLLDHLRLLVLGVLGCQQCKRLFPVAQVRQVFERIRQPTLPEDIVKKFVQTWAESMTASVQAQMEALLRDCFATPAA